MEKEGEQSKSTGQLSEDNKQHSRKKRQNSKQKSERQSQAGDSQPPQGAQGGQRRGSKDRPQQQRPSEGGQKPERQSQAGDSQPPQGAQGRQRRGSKDRPQQQRPSDGGQKPERQSQAGDSQPPQGAQGRQRRGSKDRPQQQRPSDGGQKPERQSQAGDSQSPQGAQGRQRRGSKDRPQQQWPYEGGQKPERQSQAGDSQPPQGAQGGQRRGSKDRPQQQRPSEGGQKPERQSQAGDSQPPQGAQGRQRRGSKDRPQQQRPSEGGQKPERQSQAGDSQPPQGAQGRQRRGSKDRPQQQRPSEGGQKPERQSQAGDSQPPQGAQGGQRGGFKDRPQQQRPYEGGQKPERQSQAGDSQSPQGAQGGQRGGFKDRPQQQRPYEGGQKPERQSQAGDSQSPQGAQGRQRRGSKDRPQQQRPSEGGQKPERQSQAGDSQSPQGAQGGQRGGFKDRPQQQRPYEGGQKPERQSQAGDSQSPQGAQGRQRRGSKDRPQQQRPSDGGQKPERQSQAGDSQPPQGAQGGQRGGFKDRPQQQRPYEGGQKPERQSQAGDSQSPQGAQGGQRGGFKDRPQQQRPYEGGQKPERQSQAGDSQPPQGAQGGQRGGFKDRPQQQRPYEGGQKPERQSQAGDSQSPQGAQGGQRGDFKDRPQQQWLSKGGQCPPAAKLGQGSEPDPPYMDESCAGIKRGTLGNRGIIETNYFKMDLNKMPDIGYHYDVAITPDRPKKFMREVFDECQKKYFPKIGMAFDGAKNCYTVLRLEQKAYKYKIQISDSNGRLKEFDIQIKETDTIEVDLKSLKSYHNERIFDKPMRALQALEVVLSSAYHEQGLKVGRSYYCKPSNMYDLKEGYEMYTGIYQAAILGEEPLFNVDVAHKSFPKCQTILQYLDEIGVQNMNSPLVRPQLTKVIQYLKGINILYTPPKCFGATERTYKISGVGNPANNTYFKDETDKKMSVSEYFDMRGYPLKYPYLNCVDIKIGQRSISLPMELCTILDYQNLGRKDAQLSQLIRHTATSTMERKRKIMNLLELFTFKQSLSIQQFGVTLGKNFIKVQMRLLPPPELQYNGGIVQPRNGSWQIGNNCQFLETTKPPGGHKWAIIYHNRSRMNFNMVHDFKKHIYTVAKKLNVFLTEQCQIDTFENIDGTLRNMSSANFALVIVILPSYGVTYSNVKQTAELKYGVLTQCIKEQTVQRSLRDLSICNNFLLKINAKLNGTNHKVANDRIEIIHKLLMPVQNVMFLGADVTHPSPDQRNIPSVVGAAASHDANGACYNIQYRLQAPKLEEIEDMEGITKYHLNMYIKYQNRPPDYIIYYRDGVSDGQFPIIRSKELCGIRSACRNLKCNPKIVCLIVVKRHHTRFFPITVSPRDKFNNAEPGTVVDQRIVHPNEVQFFLVSHQAIQGTAKPTRYNVIENEANFTVDILQKLSYNLCHLFPRCNRAVSYPAPAYLAHLVAYRGRVYIDGVQRFGNLKAEYEKRKVNENIMKYSPMYFV